MLPLLNIASIICQRDIHSPFARARTRMFTVQASSDDIVYATPLKDNGDNIVH